MSQRILDMGFSVLEIESKSILLMKERMTSGFVLAVNMIKACKGKIILTGMGKSGHIARKLASTFCSTGTPAVFVHPAESSHGDLGIIAPNDLVLAFSYGGESSEFNDVIKYITRKGIPLIAVTGGVNSSLAKAATVILDVHVPKEACPLGLAPTASSTASLAMGDAVAMAVLNEKGFSPEDFAEFHPGGSLGFRLLTKVKDVMHEGKSLPFVGLDAPIKEVLSIMTHRDVRGVAGIVDHVGDLVGVITDGDVRRRLEKNQDPLSGTAKDLMTKSPRTIDANELAERALFVMEQFQIQMVFVLDKNADQPNRPIGLLHIQDLLKAKIK